MHTVLSGDGVAAKTVAITGCGPIGLFAIAVAKACGATQVFALEINEYRRRIAEKMKADFVLDPANARRPADRAGPDRRQWRGRRAGDGGASRRHPSGLPDSPTRRQDLPAGNSFARPLELNLAEDIIFKGATVLGINGRRIFQTWYQMQALLKAGKLDLHPVITDRMAMADFAKGMDRLRTGEASKILLYPNGTGSSSS